MPPSDSTPDERPSEPIMRLVDVHKSFGDNEVIRGLSLDIYEGETTVIMGESGSGKSVLIKLMNGLLIPDKGDVFIYGKSTKELSRRELRELRLRVGTMFQNYALFDSMTIAENLEFPLRQNTKLPGREISAKAQKLLDTLGLGDTGTLVPSELSGGMKKRVALARTIISDPSVVLFDEPTTGLDPVMIEFVDNMLIDTRERYGITSVVISHDMASAFRLADRMAMLHDGRITFMGSPDDARTTDDKVVREFVDSGTSRLSSGGRKAEERADEEGLTWDELPPPDEEPLVEVHDLQKTFGTRKILKGINLYVLPNRITTIIGGSGSGKSVTMKHILGLFEPTGGQVKVFGKDLAKMSERELVQLRLRFGMLFQGAALFDSMTVLENVMFPLRQRPKNKVPPKEAREKALDVLQRLHIEKLADKSAGEVSSGQKKRVGLARAIVTEPDIMIYDEPTTGLDPVMTHTVNDMIAEAQEEFDITAIVVSHDMASTFRISHRIAMLYHGQILAFGTPEEIMASSNPHVREFIFAGTTD